MACDSSEQDDHSEHTLKFEANTDDLHERSLQRIHCRVHREHRHIGVISGARSAPDTNRCFPPHREETPTL
jgi:hypothetical protein